MNENKFKVVGVQVLPKCMTGKHQSLHQIAEQEVKYSHILFEKLIRPVNKSFEEKMRYEDSKSRSNRRFSVIGLVNLKEDKNINGSILFNTYLDRSMNVIDELESLTRVVN